MLSLLASVLVFSPSDEAAIRQVYRLKNRYFESKDARRLRPTDLPSFFAEGTDGSIVSNKKIWEYMNGRFAVQVACKRNERPAVIKVKGKDAVVIVLCDDDWTRIDKDGRRVRSVSRTKGRSYWTRTPQGWKQVSLHFDVVETKQPDGSWRTSVRAAPNVLRSRVHAPDRPHRVAASGYDFHL